MEIVWRVSGRCLAGAGFPNRSVFSGKGPDPDLFVLQGPENGPDFTEKSGFLS